MVTLAQSSPGDRSARAPQSKTATVMLVLAAHRFAINDLRAALVPVTQKDIAVEIADLMLAFPGKDDLTEFIPLLFEHIMVEQPTRLELAAACHRLRCTKKFRPAISEVFEELTEVAYRFGGI